jgi:2-dehydropantoate 2-reductase
MNIVIFGAGAIGSLFGALLSKKNAVTLIGRKMHIQTIRRNGLTIDGKTQLNVKISASDTIDCITSPPDLLIITVKSYDTALAIRQAKKIIAKKTCVLSLQNGLDNIGTITQVVNREQLIAGVTIHGVLFIKSGHIKHTGIGQTFLGELNGKLSLRIQNISNIFNNAGIQTVISNNIEKELWRKAIVNSCINPITAFFNCKNGYLMENPILEKMVERVCAESVNIANSHGIQIIYQDMIRKTKKVIHETFDNYSSMLQSIKRGKKTEIDSINGTFVKIGKIHKVDTALNEILLSFIKNKLQ